MSRQSLELSDEYLDSIVTKIVKAATSGYPGNANVILRGVIAGVSAQAEHIGRIKEQEEWVLNWTELSIEWEQDKEGSGIQYFDDERATRLHKLDAESPANEHKAPKGVS